MNWLKKLEAVEFAGAGRPDAVKTTDAYDILVEAVAFERARWRRVQEHFMRCTDTPDRLLEVFECPYCDEVIK